MGLMAVWQAYWLRHRHPLNRVLHVIGVPLCFMGAPALASAQLVAAETDPTQWQLWWRPLAVFAWGYALQFIGHAIEGNDAGEVCLVLRLLGLPYQAVAADRSTTGLKSSEDFVAERVAPDRSGRQP